MPDDGTPHTDLNILEIIKQHFLIAVDRVIVRQMYFEKLLYFQKWKKECWQMKCINVFCVV